MNVFGLQLWYGAYNVRFVLDFVFGHIKWAIEQKADQASKLSKFDRVIRYITFESSTGKKIEKFLFFSNDLNIFRKILYDVFFLTFLTLFEFFNFIRGSRLTNNFLSEIINCFPYYVHFSFNFPTFWKVIICRICRYSIQFLRGSCCFSGHPKTRFFVLQSVAIVWLNFEKILAVNYVEDNVFK